MVGIDSLSLYEPIFERIHVETHHLRQKTHNELKKLTRSLESSQFLLTASDGEIEHAMNQLSALQKEISIVEKLYMDQIKIIKIRKSYTDGSDYGSVSNVQLLHMCAVHIAERGYENAISLLASKFPSFAELLDLDLIKGEAKIAEGVRHGALEAAISWCRHHRFLLKRVDPQLELALQSASIDQYSLTKDRYIPETSQPSVVETPKRVRDVGSPESETASRAKKGRIYLDQGVIPQSNGCQSSLKNEMASIENSGVMNARRNSDAYGEACQFTDQARQVWLLATSRRLQNVMRMIYKRPQQNILVNHVLLGMTALKTERCKHIQLDQNAALDTTFMLKKQLTRTNCPACNEHYYNLSMWVPDLLRSYSIVEDQMFAFPESMIVMGKSVIVRYLQVPGDGSLDAQVLDPLRGHLISWADMLKVYAL